MTDVVKLSAPMAARTPRRYAQRLPKEERREQLLDVTLKLIYEQGYGGVSMEAVAREAEIAKTVVYDAFSNQQELLNALWKREQARVLTSIAEALPALPLEGDPGRILSASMRSVLESVHENPMTWRLILQRADGTPPAVRDAINRHRDRLLAQVQPMVAWAAGELGAPSLDSELLAHTLIAGAEEAVRLTLAHPRQFPPERLAGFAIDLLEAVAKRRS
jgi:AcrR family transcriptional regulator